MIAIIIPIAVILLIIGLYILNDYNKYNNYIGRMYYNSNNSPAGVYTQEELEHYRKLPQVRYTVTRKSRGRRTSNGGAINKKNKSMKKK